MILLGFGTRNLLFCEQKRYFPQNNENGHERRKNAGHSQLKNATWSLTRPCPNFGESLFRGSSLIPYPVNVSRIPHCILVKFRIEGIPVQTRYENYPLSRHLVVLVILKRNYRLDRVVSLRSWWSHFLHHDSQWLNIFHRLLLLLLSLEIFRFWDENDYQYETFSY